MLLNDQDRITFYRRLAWARAYDPVAEVLLARFAARERLRSHAASVAAALALFTGRGA